eukprot:NODE_4452_length_805_cov_34.342593_g4118_i0.p1 GENE.NODE_4452_length_805_cov_34.342593_g4118_i0~~NODE_4452_length_805_cov_34.342593_g4118_i0.p1  ORF type:complete len:198 (+),score=49.24 NODE_4452_length_805_cov_34.342593_g4118_i0:51-596(+)
MQQTLELAEDKVRVCEATAVANEERWQLETAELHQRLLASLADCTALRAEVERLNESLNDQRSVAEQLRRTAEASEAEAQSVREELKQVAQRSNERIAAVCAQQRSLADEVRSREDLKQGQIQMYEAETRNLHETIQKQRAVIHQRCESLQAQTLSAVISVFHQEAEALPFYSDMDHLPID